MIGEKSQFSLPPLLLKKTTKIAVYLLDLDAYIGNGDPELTLPQVPDYSFVHYPKAQMTRMMQARHMPTQEKVSRFCW